MSPKRQSKKGTLHYAFEVGDRKLLKSYLRNRSELNNKAVLEVLKIVHRNKNVSRLKMSPLQGSVTLGLLDVCKQLIEEGADLHSKSEIPHPLNIALREGHFEVAHLLIEHGADVNLASEDSLPMYLALENINCNVSIVKAIMDSGFPVDGIVHLIFHITSLHKAVRMNNIEVIEYLLCLQANPNVKDSKGLTPLHYAILNCHAEIVKILSKNGAIIDIGCHRDLTPMHYAISLSSCTMVKLLLSLGADIHFVNQSKPCSLMPLHFAANTCKFKIVQTLLENGADVNKIVPRTGETALHAAARADTKNNQQYKIALDCIVELLIKRKADVRCKQKSGQTPLQLSISSLNFSVSKILILSGAELNDVMDESNAISLTTFALLVGRCEDNELIQLCLDHGANWAVEFTSAINEKVSPLHGLIFSNMLLKLNKKKYEPSSMRELQLTVKMFWKMGFPFDRTMNAPWLNVVPLEQISALVQKQNMLFRGVILEQLAVVESAIMQGADVRCCSSSVPFPLHFIASKGNYEIMKCFLNEGFNVNYIDKRGETALHVTAKQGFTNCSRLLLEYGACYNYTSTKCLKTPLDFATANNHSEVVTLLTSVDNYFKEIKKGCLKKLNPDMKIFGAVMNCCNKEGHTLLARAVALDLKLLSERLINVRSSLDDLRPLESKSGLKGNRRVRKAN